MESVTEIRRVLTTRSGRWLLAITVVSAVLVAGALMGAAAPVERTFGLVVASVQATVSVTVPFFSVLLVTDLHRQRTGRVSPRLAAAVMVGIVAAGFGLLVCTVTVAVAPTAAPGGPWQHVGMLVLGSVLVQVIAALCGTGLGLLIRRRALAMLSTMVLPLGLWLILGALDLRGVQGWVTPFANATHLLSGQMTALRWLQCLVVLAVWDVSLNVAGVWRLRRRR